MATEVTPEQIEAWKQQHGDVFKIVVEDKVAYLRKPDRKVLSFAGAAGAKEPMKFNEAILRNCWLGGDMDIQNNDDYFLAASSIIQELIVIKEATLEKL